MSHMQCALGRSEHFLCEEPECEGCFTAFGTPDELEQHRRERHSQRMPRWDPRAPTRQLQLSPVTLVDQQQAARQRHRGAASRRPEGEFLANTTAHERDDCRFDMQAGRLGMRPCTACQGTVPAFGPSSTMAGARHTVCVLCGHAINRDSFMLQASG